MIYNAKTAVLTAGHETKWAKDWCTWELTYAAEETGTEALKQPLRPAATREPSQPKTRKGFMKTTTLLTATSMILSTFFFLIKAAEGSPYAHCNEMENISMMCRGDNNKIYPSRIAYCRSLPKQPGCDYINSNN